MKAVFKLKRIYILSLIPISVILLLFAKNSSFFAEQIFSLRIYKWLSQIISFFTGIIPISIAEILILTLPAVGLVLFLRFLVRIINDKGNRIDIAVKGILNIFCSISIVFFSFTLLAGINYYRYPFSYYSGLEIRESSEDELYAMTKDLIKQANELRKIIPETDEDGVFSISVSDYELADLADEAMKLLSEEYPVLGGYYSAPKPVLLSSAMSYTEITGIFVPFTMEANVNVHIPDYSIPATMLHELAHLRGFMREDEANYIAYLAGMSSDNAELQYSSTMLALIISGNALYKQDNDVYFSIRELYSEEVKRDIRANSMYWVKYEDTAISTVSNKVNDTYLKANDQKDGVKSYGRMVDLLLAKYRKDHIQQDIDDTRD